MASTAEGRGLTESHRLAQLQVAGLAAAEARVLWSRLDVNDLDGSTPYWLASNVAAVNRRVKQSQDVAAEYLTTYRGAEVGAPGRVVLGAAPGTPDALRFAGPVRVKQLIAGGLTRQEAYDRAFVKFEGIVRRQALMGGRTTIANTASADRRAVGWRRVTDGDPCAFCAMLASRGPMYKSRYSTVTQGEGLRYHGHCGCTAEIIYGTWAPTADEQAYVDVYKEARKSLEEDGQRASTSNVLSEMRRLGSFRDSVRPR